jgi:uncharacterized protein (TIGR00645 family)
LRASAELQAALQERFRHASQPLAMLKRFFEAYLLRSRWLLAPFFVMLTIGLFVEMVSAAKHLWSLIKMIAGPGDEHVTLELLNLVDLTLTGALVVLVAVSVYENFVSQVDAKDHKDWPGWMGNIDFSQLKLKLLSTIVAISAIRLLEAFMDVPEINDRELYFYIGIHLTFVFSTLAFAVSERLSGHDRAGGQPPR